MATHGPGHLVLGMILMMGVAAPLRAQECSSLEDLSWMLGYWESRKDKSLDVESWTRVSDNTFEGFGSSFTLPGFRKTFHESFHLASMSGEVFYIAKVPGNENAVSFKLTRCAENSAVFENPQHDFPTSLAYGLQADGGMTVDVSGPDGKGFSVFFTPSDPQRRIALTFDDAPRASSPFMSGEERTRRLIENLAAAGSPPVIFYCITGGLDEPGAARLGAYQEAGHYIGNHTHSHQRMDSLGVDGYIADILAAHEVLSRYESFVPLFRFPYLDEGRDIATRDRLREALQSMGYSNGYVTIDNYDFFMDSIFQRALAQGRTFDERKLGSSYVDALMESVRFYSDLGKRYLGRNPEQILLLHENDLAAMYIGDLIRALRAEGWTLIDAREAYADPIAATVPDTLFNGQGRVAAIAHTLGAARQDLVHRAENTAYLEQHFEQHDAFGAPAPWMPGDSDLLFSSNHEGNTEIYLLPAGQKNWLNLSQHAAGDNYPVWSPDGQRIAFHSNRNGKLDVFVMDADGSNLQQLTDDPEHDYLPSWTPDGSMITFASWRTEPGEAPGANHIYIMASDGSGQRRLLADSPGASATVEWSPDGQQMIQTRKSGEDHAQLVTASADGTLLRQLTEDERFNGAPSFSPDGSRLAFYSDDQEQSRIDVINTDGSDRRSVVTYGQSYYPHWSPDGCWLVYTAALVPGNAEDLEIRAARADGSDDWLTLVSGKGRIAEASWRPGLSGPAVGCP